MSHAEVQIDSDHVLYARHGCGVADVRVAVSRRRQDENIVKWINRCAETIANHHRLNSPKCTAQVCDIKIPLTQDAQQKGETNARQES